MVITFRLLQRNESGCSRNIPSGYKFCDQKETYSMLYTAIAKKSVPINIKYFRHIEDKTKQSMCPIRDTTPTFYSDFGNHLNKFHAIRYLSGIYSNKVVGFDYYLLHLKTIQRLYNYADS